VASRTRKGNCKKYNEGEEYLPFFLSSVSFLGKRSKTEGDERKMYEDGYRNVTLSSY
jgi:hypothetical protein